MDVADYRLAAEAPRVTRGHRHPAGMQRTTASPSTPSSNWASTHARGVACLADGNDAELKSLNESVSAGSLHDRQSGDSLVSPDMTNRWQSHRRFGGT